MTRLDGPELPYCDEMPEEGWLDRFVGRCAIWEQRDCPRWAMGHRCGRTGEMLTPGEVWGEAPNE